MRRLEFRDGAVARFYEAELDGTTLVERWGLIDESGPHPVDGPGTERRVELPDAPQAVDARDQGLATRLSSGWVEPYRADPQVAEFFESGAAFDHLVEGMKPRVPEGQVAALEVTHGMRLPPALRRFVGWRDQWTLAWPVLGEWRVWSDDIRLPPAGVNPFAWRVEQAQGNALGLQLSEILAGLVYIGSAGDGDGWLAALDPRFPGHTPIMHWSHDRRDLRAMVADSLESFAELHRLQAGFAAHRETARAQPLPAALVEGVARLAPRARPTGHCRDLFVQAGVEPAYQGDLAPRLRFYRGEWIGRLLADGPGAIDEAKALFGLLDHGQFAVDDALAGPYLGQLASTSLYWLWRTWLFEDPAHAAVRERCASSASPVVRGAAEVLQGVAAGRSTLGRLDLLDLRRRWRARDLDPARESARQAEAEARAASADAARQAAEARADALVAAGDRDAIISALWAHPDDRPLVDRLVGHLAAHDAALGPYLARLQWLLDGARHADGQHVGHEASEVLEALCAGPRELAACLLGRPEPGYWPVLARFDDARVTARLVGRLTAALDAGDDAHLVRAAITACGAHGDPAAFEPICRALAAFAYPAGDVVSSVQNQPVLVAAAAALGRMGDPRAIEPLLDLASTAEPDALDAALGALGRLGSPQALPVLLRFTEGPHATTACWALAHLGDSGGLPRLDALVEQTVGAPEARAALAVARAWLRHQLGLPVDLEMVRFAVGVTTGTTDDQSNLQLAILGLLAAHGAPDEARALARAWLDAPLRAVREAARQTLARLGESTPLDWWDWPHLAAHLKATGEGSIDAALTAAMRGPRGVFRVNALRWLAERARAGHAPSDEAVSAAVSLTEGLTQAGFEVDVPASDRPRSIRDAVAALAALGHPQADAALHRLAGHAHPAVREVDPFTYNRDGLVDRLIDAHGPITVPAPPLDPQRARCSIKVRALDVAHAGRVNRVVRAGEGWLTASTDAVALFDPYGGLGARIELGWSHVNDVALSTDGRIIAVAGQTQAAGFDARTGEQRWRLSLPRSEVVLAFRNTFVFGAGTQLWWVDAARGTVRSRVDACSSRWVHHLVPIDDRRALVAAWRDQRYQIWHLDRQSWRQQIALPERRHGDPTGYTIGPGREVLVARADRSVSTIDRQGAHRRHAILRHVAHNPALSPDGAWLAATCGPLLIIDPDRGAESGRVSHPEPFSALAWVERDRLIAGDHQGGVWSIRVRPQLG